MNKFKAWKRSRAYEWHLNKLERLQKLNAQYPSKEKHLLIKKQETILLYIAGLESEDKDE